MLRDATPKTIHLQDYRPPAFLIDRTELNFDLRERDSRVGARLHLRRNPAHPDPRAALRLDGEALRLLRIAIDDRALDDDEYRLDAESLTLPNPPDHFVLETEVEIQPQLNTALEGLYRSGGKFCTQCEAQGFRRITYYLDRPDVMAPFRVTLRADAKRYPVLLSNGNPVANESLADGRHLAIWEDPFPKPAYLFALVAGDLAMIEDHFVTRSGRDVTLRIFVEPENLDRCDHAMRSLKKAMRWDEEHYGREYDLDIFMIVAVGDFNMGAMENKGLNLFNAKFVLARPDTATDRDFQGIEGVIAHEYFHNWTGNRITCRDWFQLSLKEGLTVFRDQEFSADMGSRGVKRIEDVRLLRAHQFAEDASPMAHPVRPESYIEINNFYTVTVYEKGAEVVRMQARLLGPETFRKATDLYFERFDGRAVTTDDFVQCMADASGRDLTQFKRWYSQAGTPELSARGEYDTATLSYRLTLSQHCPPTPGQPDKQPFHIPVAVGLIDAHGQEMPLRLAGSDQIQTTALLELTEAEQTFVFEGIDEHPIPSLLRGFSAPVKLDYPYEDRELMFLMAHDNDDFCRWDAAQTLARKLLLARVDALSRGEDQPVDGGFVEAFRRALRDRDADRALLAEVLTLPSESLLGEYRQPIDVDTIHAAREATRRELAEHLREDLIAVYHACAETGAYDLEPASIARRALKNLCLDYLATLNDSEANALLLAQYHADHNMTDVMAALHRIADGALPEREQILDDFRRRWSDDPLVLDKWFTVQALSHRVDTLARVEALMEDPAFSIENPNKVRALIGAFASGNPVRFHAADGEGYRFLVDRVLELDGINPQVAARQIRVLSRWRHYDDHRQALIRAQLERLVEQPSISRDVYEIVSKSLGSEA